MTTEEQRTAPQFTEEWYSPEQLALLAGLARSTDGLPASVVEFGCWQGRSTLTLAAAVAPEVLYAVDTWCGSQNGDPNDPTARLAGERDIWAEFMANVRAADAWNIVPVRQDWRIWLARSPYIPVRFAHLDAEHDAVSVEGAIRGLLPRMVPGGILAGDDWHWQSVKAGIAAAGITVESEGNLWWRRV